MLKTKFINIDSKDCIKRSGRPNNITFNLFEPIVRQPDEMFIISFVNTVLPISFYQVSYSNQYLNVVETYGGVPHAFTVVLTQGNYNVYTFMDMFIQKLRSISYFHLTYSYTYSKEQNKVTISVAESGYTVSFLFGSGANSSVDCAYLIGFGTDDVSFDSTTPLVSTNVVNMSPFDAYYIYTEGFGISQAYNSKTKSISNMFLKVPINGSPNTYVFYDNRTNQVYKSQINSISSINLSLRDSDGFLIDTNGIEWSILIRVDIAKHPDFTRAEEDALVPVEIV